MKILATDAVAAAGDGGVWVEIGPVQHVGDDVRLPPCQKMTDAPPQREPEFGWFRAISAILFLAGLSLPGIVDLYFVGRLDTGSTVVEQAALGLALVFLWWFGAVVAAGLLTLSAIDDTPRQMLPNALMVATVLGLLGLYGGWYGAGPWFGLLDVGPTIGRLATTYSHICLLALPAVGALFAFRIYFERTGVSPGHLWGCLVLNIANIGLNAVFIYGVGPLTLRSLEGVAAATAIAFGLGLAVTVAISLFDRTRGATSPWQLRHLSPSRCWTIIAGGALPTLAVFLSLAGVTTAFVAIAAADQTALVAGIETTHRQLGNVPGRVGAADAVDPGIGSMLMAEWSELIARSRPPIYLAAATCVFIPVALLVAPGPAVAAVLFPSLRRAYVDGDETRIDRETRCATIVAALFVAPPALLCVVYPTSVVDLFTSSPDVAALAVDGLRLIAAQMLFVSTGFVTAAALIAVGHSRLVIAAFAALAIAMGALATVVGLVLDGGFMGILLSVAVVVALTSLVLAVAFWIGTWRNPDA